MTLVKSIQNSYLNEIFGHIVIICFYLLAMLLFEGEKIKTSLSKNNSYAGFVYLLRCEMNTEKGLP